MIKIDQERCVGCGICVNVCSEGIEIIDGKARIKNQNADCLKNAVNACPRGAILIDEEETENKDTNNPNLDHNQSHWTGQGAGQSEGFGMGRRFNQGRGMGKGMGRGRGFGGGRGQGRGRW